MKMNYHRQYVGLLLQVIHFIANCLAENLILNINYKKPIAVTSDAFLSFTLDPATLLHNTDALTKNIEKSTNMARGLVPAYIRLGGPQSNSYIFERAYLHNADVDSNDMLFEKQWTLIPEWAKNVGLNLIISIAPRYIENESEKDSKNSMNITELLSFSDFMGYNISWQLGYECQTKCNLSGGDLGQYVANFREILKTFPRYSNSLITGPDIVTYKTGQEQKYLQDYLNSADAALSAITWHPDFASVSLNNDSVSMHYDNMVADKNELYKIISRTARKKPLWIAESKPEKFKHEYLGALIWTTRLGNAAKLGVQVLMRQPSNFYKATPDYWVSLLHKTLVGHQVLELNVHSNNESYVHLYSQCTKPSALYDKGAITIFGINLTPKEITANLKGLKIETLHQYILSPDFKTGNNKMLSEKVLLNNKPLDLINDKKLPNLNPEIIFKPDGLELKLSSGDIGFWVIPNAKVKACDYSEEEIAKNLIEKRLWKRHKNIIQQGNQERKINDMKHYQHSIQESERIKRDIGRKLVEIAPRMDNVLKKRMRFDNVKDNNMNERKMKRKDDFRRDELLIPFNPRIIDSGENNFYGFFRRNPIKGFPENDIFITMGDSSEQNNKDYDYVQDENDENDSTVKNMQHTKELTQKHAEDNTWIEMENDHVPNEFFENVKFFNTRIKENPQSYGDLLEAEFFPQELPDKKKEKRAVEKDMQKLVNYYDFKEHDRDTKYKALDLALRRSSMPLSQFVEAPIYIDYQASNMKPEKTKLKVESGLKASSFFYQPSQIATVNSNYNIYNTKNTKHEETKVNKEKILTTNISNNKDNINTEIIKFSRPADINTEYPVFYNKRAKRSNRAKIQKILAEEMIKENGENTKDCHCRIIRASQLSKKLCNCRVKRDNQIFADSSSEIESVESTQSEGYVENSMTKEEYENIIAGEILPSTSVIKSDYEEHDIITGTITTESSTLDYRPSYETQTIDVNSTSIMDNSEINNISEQYHNVEEFNTKRFMVNSEFSPSNEEDSNNNKIVNNDITKEMLFRTKPSNVQSENEATTYDPFQIVSKMLSDNKSNSQEFITSTTEYAQETIREKTQNFINKKKRTDSYSRVTENQKNEKRRDNNYKISLKSTHSLETTQRIAEEQMTTETILSKQITGILIDNSESNESKIKSDDNIQQNVEDNQNKNNQDIDVNSTSIMDNSEINNISEQYHNVEESNTKRFMVNSEFSPSNEEDSNNNDIVNNDITKEMFFRTKSPNVQSENEATTYDPFQIVSKIFSDNKSNSQEFIASTTEYAQETTREKTQNLINKKKRTDSYSRVTENQKDKERRDNNYKNSLKSTNILERTQKIAEEQMTTETILSKRITGIAIDNSELNESKIKSDDNIKQNVEDNQNKDNQEIESEVETQLKKNIRTKKLKNIFRTAPLREHARHEEYLNRRTEQTNKLKEKLYAKRKRLLQQYRQELTKIADEQKRNLKRRETWERFHENNDLRHLIDQEEFVDILIDNNKNNNNNKYEIPVKLVPKQYENIPDQIYTLAKVKEERNPKYNKYYQFPRHLKVTKDDENSTFISSDRKYNQYYEPLPRIIKNEQQLAEASRFLDHDRYFEKLIEDERESKAASKSYGRRIFAIDPSTYRGGDPTLQQLYEDHSKLPKYYSEIKFENQNPVPRWIYQVHSKSTLNEDHQASKSQEYMKKISIKNDQENADIIYIFDTQKQFNRPNNLELNNIYRNLKVEHDNLDMPIIDKEMKLTKDVSSGKYIENEKFDSHDEKKDILNIEKTEGTKNAEKFVNSKNIDMDKEEMLNIRKFKSITEPESKTEHLNDKRKNIAKNIYKIVKDTQEINNLNEKIKNNINTEMSNNNEAIKDVKKITDNDSELSKLGKGNARRRRDVKKQRSDEYLKRLLYFLLTKTNTQDGSNYDMYDHLKEDSKEIFSKQPIPFYPLTKNDELELSTVPFQKLKNCLASSERDLEIDQQDEKEYKSKYIVFIPTKDKDSYKMLKVKDYNDLLEHIEIPYSDENQYLLQKISDSIMGYSDDESSEELVYEDLSDLLNDKIENISDEEIYSSESVQDVSVDVKDNKINDKSEKEDEQYKSEEIRYLEMKNQMRSDERGMFLLFPWKENEKEIRQRREIRDRITGSINQIEDEIQSKSNKFILTENIKDEDIKNSVNKNNVEQEKEKIITKKSAETNYLQTQIDKRNRDNLLEDFIRARKKNYLYNNKILFMKNKEKDKSLKNNNLRNDEKLPSVTKKVTPKLQNAIIDGLENTQNTTESVESFIDNFQEKYNETVLMSDEEKHLKNKTSETIYNPFHVAIINIKKIIAFLSKISQIFM